MCICICTYSMNPIGLLCISCKCVHNVPAVATTRGIQCILCKSHIYRICIYVYLCVCHVCGFSLNFWNNSCFSYFVFLYIGSNKYKMLQENAHGCILSRLHPGHGPGPWTKGQRSMKLDCCSGFKNVGSAGALGELSSQDQRQAMLASWP